MQFWFISSFYTAFPSDQLLYADSLLSEETHYFLIETEKPLKPFVKTKPFTFFPSGLLSKSGRNGKCFEGGDDMRRVLKEQQDV